MSASRADIRTALAPSSPATPTGSARSVLVTILGEFVLPNDGPVRTSSFLYILTGLGYEIPAARQALNRFAERGWLTRQRRGRQVCWLPTPAARDYIETGTERVFSLHAARTPWDRNWLVLFVSVPHERRKHRDKLHSALRWAGFGNPMPGVWVSPHTDRAAEAERVVDELGLRGQALSFIGPAGAVGLNEREIVRQGWELHEVADHYEELLAQFANLEPADGDPVLFAQVKLISAWRRFPFIDPQLPEELLPGWIGRQAAVTFHDRWQWWFERAQLRWREINR
ncbi:PaaX family transcriptional regulator [Amycolatopsis pithecellobii]|nr:PaaX family transcriptional regulator C-terminal domain-containing protein [Amycolatopsis pithecellobii]